MRRKSGRNARKSSPEKAKPESVKNSRRSTRRQRRSSSRSSAESEGEATHTPDLKKPDQDNVEGNVETDVDKCHNDSRILEEKSADSESKGRNIIKVNFLSDSERSSKRGQSRGTPDKDINEDSQEQEEATDESKNKGKSKGISKSKIEQSSNNIEPEIENENVQGTPQSPSIDNADNENVVQNVTDTPQTNPEEGNSKTGGEVIENEGHQMSAVQEEVFESEYAQEADNKSVNNIIEKQNNSAENANSESRRNSVKSSHNEEKSTTPEPRINQSSSRNRSMSGGEKDQDRRESSDDKGRSRRKSGNEEKTEGSRKKITLRRSPPVNKDRETSPHKERRSTTEESGIENEGQESKSSKKIFLKRSTSTVERSLNKEKEDEVSRRRSTASDEYVEKKRRLSSLCEDKSEDVEDKPKKTLAKIKLIRNFSQTTSEGQDQPAPPQRQEWGKSDWLNKISANLYKVDVDLLKTFCPSVKFLSETEVKLESTPPRERTKSETEVVKRKLSIDNKSEDSDRPEYEKQTSEDSSSEVNPNIIAMNRKISIVDDTASKLRPPPSPAKHSTSNVLFITNLVRPFTVKQLKELLERTGKIKEEGFWTDRIKSKCYAQYESVEEAEATRNALHGVNWPIGNGKKLIIDYATAEDLEKAKNPAPPPVVIPEKLPEKENREPERLDDKQKEREKEDRKKKDGGFIREWDAGKEDKRRVRSRSRTRSRERVRKHSRRSYTPDDFLVRKHRKVEEPVPQTLMDDLFLKTKATPSIYWQPLSPEEIATKQQQRLVRMEEHKRRIEENRGRGRDTRRGSFRRR